MKTDSLAKQNCHNSLNHANFLVSVTFIKKLRSSWNSVKFDQMSRCLI